MVRLQLSWILCVAAAGCGVNTSTQECCSPGAVPAPAHVFAVAPAPPAPAAETPLRAEQFESGELKLADVSSHQLEVFLRDLNRRRDYDYSQHAGQPGPNHQYLTTWIGRVSSELVRREYSYDASGELHTPDNSVVPTR